jgi:hypothetical protein
VTVTVSVYPPADSPLAVTLYVTKAPGATVAGPEVPETVPLNTSVRVSDTVPVLVSIAVQVILLDVLPPPQDDVVVLTLQERVTPTLAGPAVMLKGSQGLVEGVFRLSPV